MQHVWQYLKTELPEHALVRLCSLAQRLDIEGIMELAHWEQAYDASQLNGAIDRGINCLEQENIPTQEELQQWPLAWLVALDRWLYLDTHRDTFNPKRIFDEGDQFWLIPRRGAWQAKGKLTEQFTNVKRWLHHHFVIPASLDGLQLRAVPLPGDLEASILRAHDWWKPNIALVHFADAVNLVLDCSGDHFTVTGLSNPAGRFVSIEGFIALAEQERVGILVFPELTIMESQREEIKRTIRQRRAANSSEVGVPYILLGSFHQLTDGQWHNRSELICGLDGSTLLRADKRCPVTYSHYGERLARAPEPTTLLASPIGLLGIAICKDVFEEPTRPLWNRVGPDWLLIPSMSNKLTPHRRTTADLANRHGTITLCANQEMPAAEEPVCGYIQAERCEDSKEDFAKFVVSVPLL